MTFFYRVGGIRLYVSNGVDRLTLQRRVFLYGSMGEEKNGWWCWVSYCAAWQEACGRAGAGSLKTTAGQAEAQVAVPHPEKKKARATIYISGVQSPGLYQVEPGIRYQEALEVAGGPTEEADLTRVNLAKKSVRTAAR